MRRRILAIELLASCTLGPASVATLFAALAGGTTSQLGQTGSFGVLTVGALSGL